MYIYFLYSKNFCQAILQHIISDLVQNYWTLFSIPAWPWGKLLHYYSIWPVSCLIALFLAHYQQRVGTQIVTVKRVSSCCNSLTFVVDEIAYQTLIRSFLIKSWINKNQIMSWPPLLFTFILCFWVMIPSFFAFFCVLCKGEVHCKLGRISV